MTAKRKSFFDFSSITPLEVIGWIVIVLFLWSLGAYTMLVDYERRLIQVSLFRLITNEATSGASALVLVLFVRAMIDRFPFTSSQMAGSLMAHGLGTLVFSALHVGIMAALREVVFWLAGQTYVHAAIDHPDGILGVLRYEYTKDLPIYVAITAVILLYRYFKSDASNAEITSEEREVQGAGVALKKILVKKGKNDRALDLETIDWFQGASNYVRVFACGEEFLIRGTLNAIEAKLKNEPFLRVHRSFIVNLTKIAEIVPLEGGGHRLELTGGAHIPVGRRYRDSLYVRLKT